MKKILFMIFFMGGAFPAALCAEEAPAAGAVAASTVPVSSLAVSSPTYSYKGEKYRDPFVSLAGQGAAYFYSGDDTPFDPNNVELKGVLKMKSGRWALLRTAAGASFIVKEGKLWDSKRKLVKGYVGIVKEKGLELLGPNNQVFTFNLKTGMEKTR